MTEKQEHSRFKHLFWFSVGVVMFCMGFSVYIIHKDKTQIAAVQTFWLSTGAAGCIGFIVGSSVSKSKLPETKEPPVNPEVGSVSLSLQANTTSEQKSETEIVDKPEA